ncbi:MAG: efflux transporter periplasmic adaptor subunit, partial [Bacteroidales bacterium]|nr:efflux transporter periplasmic adaptor subunit [Candidatus Sodaliphilus fimicaballi]
NCAVVSTSYVPVTFQFDNNGTVIPGAYAEVYLITGIREGVISVPTTALTEEQGVYYVYCKVDDHAYRKQEVTLGATDGENTEILTGLNGGESVVIKGAINVKLAGASNAIPAHTHNH